jgi:deoxycytidine triphosphate deaminase
MLSGEDILASLGKHIIIYPFDPSQLRGSTYNLKVGKFVWLHPDPGTSGSVRPLEGVETPTGRRFDIPPGALVHILTEEVIYVDSTVAGLLHSKVDMVTKGFSHISTTLDPNWQGPLLITMQNCSSKTLALWQGETFVKLSFYRLSHPTKIQHNNPPGRSDRLRALGLQFPEGQENFLDEPINWNKDHLRKTFFESVGWREVQKRKLHRLRRFVGWSQWILIFALCILAISLVNGPSWMSTEVRAVIIGASFSTVIYFLLQKLGALIKGEL